MRRRTPQLPIDLSLGSGVPGTKKPPRTWLPRERPVDPGVGELRRLGSEATTAFSLLPSCERARRREAIDGERGPRLQKLGERLLLSGVPTPDTVAFAGLLCLLPPPRKGRKPCGISLGELELWPQAAGELHSRISAGASLRVMPAVSVCFRASPASHCLDAEPAAGEGASTGAGREMPFRPSTDGSGAVSEGSRSIAALVRLTSMDDA